MVTRETSGVTPGYLLDSEDSGDFFLYRESDASFAPHEEIVISDTTSVVILSDTSQANLPSIYQEANLTINGKNFPIWQDPSQEGEYVLYGINNNGETGYYRYDPTENTYQKFEVPTTSSETKEQKGILIVARMKSRKQNMESIEPHDAYRGNCGAQLPEGAEFCGNCGYPVRYKEENR